MPSKCECRFFKQSGKCSHVNFREPGRERDREFERAFLHYVEELAKFMGAVPDGSFLRLVQYRVDGTGVDHYGDTSFLNDSRDLPHEGREEMADGTFYAMGEAEKRKWEPGHEGYHEMAQAAAHAYMADVHFRRGMMVARSE